MEAAASTLIAEEARSADVQLDVPLLEAEGGSRTRDQRITRTAVGVASAEFRCGALPPND